MAGRGGWTYIMASQKRGTIYIGVTANLYVRVQQHRTGVGSKFTTQYECQSLVWYQYFHTIEAAIQKEKSLKRYPRDWKLNLVERANPDWNDLFEAYCESASSVGTGSNRSIVIGVREHAVLSATP